jgi:TIR domain-containing protein
MESRSSSAKEENAMIDSFSIEQLARIVIGGVAAGKTVEIDGLGAFHPDPAHGLRFEPYTSPKVFVAHVKEDAEAAGRICDALESAGFRPWLDARKLLPGQNWPRAIELAIETSDFFVACFSENSVNKKGGFQAELRYALDCARRMPLDEIFIVPVRLNACRMPRSIQRELHQVDLFPDWASGIRRVVAMIRTEAARVAPESRQF